MGSRCSGARLDHVERSSAIHIYFLDLQILARFLSLVPGPGPQLDCDVIDLNEGEATSSTSTILRI